MSSYAGMFYVKHRTGSGVRELLRGDVVMGVCVDMKKMILSVIAILLIAGVLYVAIETPAATPVLVVLGPIAGFAIIGLAIYIRVGDMAERIRNMKTVAR